MTEKRFTELTSSIDYYTIWDNKEDKGLTVEDAVDLLNEQENTIHQLTLRINEIATKYRFLKEFSKDTDPNEAVNHIIHELMMNTKELRR